MAGTWCGLIFIKDFASLCSDMGVSQNQEPPVFEEPELWREDSTLLRLFP